MMRLELIDITKRYPGVLANDGVNLQVRPGEIHALLGENGAGKSTLMKIVCGALQPDRGELRWNGAGVRPGDPRRARALGIAMVFQPFSLFESMSVAENVWLGQDGKRSLEAVVAELRRLGNELGLAIEPERPVQGLSVGERQRVEILRALMVNPELLILDEPTSVLTPSAVTQLFETLRELARRGCSILYISHKLDEIRALCHTCTVLRAGRVVATVDPAKETLSGLARLMIGREPPRPKHTASAPGEILLDVSLRGVPAQSEPGLTLHEVCFTLRQREILGVAGVSGNGQKELLALLSGEDCRAPSGSVRLRGVDISREGPARRRELGLRFVPDERLGRATVPELSLERNVLLTRTEPVHASGWLDLPALGALTRKLIDDGQVKARGPRATAKSLSGGNLQKFIAARELDAHPDVLIVSQPTWGVDIGAAAQIRARILGLRDAGACVLVVSEDLDELFEICDALVVIAGGRLSPRVDIGEASVERIGAWMSGLFAAQAEPRAESPMGVSLA